MKHLRLFSSAAEYEAAKSNIEKPYVAYEESNDKLCFGQERITIELYYADGHVAKHSSTSMTSDLIEGEHTQSNPNTTLVKAVLKEGVTSFGEGAFNGCSNLTEITIPNSVTSIGTAAFYHCTSLTSVTIPNSVTSIDTAAFYHCTSLTSVTIPNSVTSIDNAAFNGCSGLTSITIPDSVTSIGQSAFYNCTSLTSVTISNSVTSIGVGPESVFGNCSNLTSIYCNSVNEPFAASSGTFVIGTGKGGVLHVKSGGSAATYPTWMNDQGNLGLSGLNGTWTVVDDL